MGKIFRMRTQKLRADASTLATIFSCAECQCPPLEVAVALRVSVDRFSEFLATNEKAREAWRLGKESGRVTLERCARVAQKYGRRRLRLGR